VKDKKHDILVSQKNIVIRIIFFVLLVVIAVLAFYFALTGNKKYATGYQKLEANVDDSYPYLNSIVTTYMYMEGNANSIKTNLRMVNSTYTNFLRKIYALTDAANEYQNYISLGYINNHLNEEIVLDNDLYTILKDAYTKTNENKNYSIYADSLYAFWHQIYGMDEYQKTDYDPINNSDNENYLNELVSFINDDSSVHLVFNDTNKSVKLTISIDYKTFRLNNEITDPIISLNILREAYLVKYLSNYLSESNYDNYYIESENNLIYTHNAENIVKVKIYDEANIEEYLATYLLNKEEAVIINPRFIIHPDLYYNPYYKIGTIYRSDNINLSTGYQEQLFKETILISNDIVNTVYYDNYLNMYSELTEVVKDELSALHIKYFLVNMDNTVIKNFNNSLEYNN
jgi:hypothetical protein